MTKISKYGSEKIIFNELGEPMFRRCITHDGVGTKDIPVAERGFTKELTVSVVLRKRYFSEADYEYHTAYFLQKYKLSMPNDRDLKYLYFYYNPKVMENVCVRDFRANLVGRGTNYMGTTTIDIMSGLSKSPESDAYHYGIKKLGKPKKITPEKANVLLREKQVLGIFSAKGENLVTP